MYVDFSISITFFSWFSLFFHILHIRSLSNDLSVFLVFNGIDLYPRNDVSLPRCRRFRVILCRTELQLIKHVLCLRYTVYVEYITTWLHNTCFVNRTIDVGRCT